LERNDVNMQVEVKGLVDFVTKHAIYCSVLTDLLSSQQRVLAYNYPRLKINICTGEANRRRELVMRRRKPPL
jgi:hypothetical protein